MKANALATTPRRHLIIRPCTAVHHLLSHEMANVYTTRSSILAQSTHPPDGANKPT